MGVPRIESWNVITMPSDLAPSGLPPSPYRPSVPPPQFFVGVLQTEDGRNEDISVPIEGVRATIGENIHGKPLENYVELYKNFPYSGHCRIPRGVPRSDGSHMNLNSDPHPDYAATNPDAKNAFLNGLLRRDHRSEEYIMGLPRNQHLRESQPDDAVHAALVRCCNMGRSLIATARKKLHL